MGEIIELCEQTIEKLENARTEYDTYNEGLIDGILIIMRELEREN